MVQIATLSWYDDFALARTSSLSALEGSRLITIGCDALILLFRIVSCLYLMGAMACSFIVKTHARTRRPGKNPENCALPWCSCHRGRGCRGIPDSKVPAVPI